MTTQFDRDPSKESTARDRVLKVLADNVGSWIPAHALTDSTVGGSEGLRRVRELRDRGYVIEQRKHENGTERDYKLVSTVPSAVPKEPEGPPKPTDAQILAALDELRLLYAVTKTQPGAAVNATLRWLRSRAL